MRTGESINKHEPTLSDEHEFSDLIKESWIQLQHMLCTAEAMHRH